MVLNQHDFWPYEKRRLDTGIYRRKDHMREDTGRRWPYTKRWSISQGESTQKEPTLSTQRSQTLNLQNREKILLFKPPSLWRLVTYGSSWKMNPGGYFRAEHCTGNNLQLNSNHLCFKGVLASLLSFFDFTSEGELTLARRNGLLREAYGKCGFLGGREAWQFLLGSTTFQL